MIRKLILILIYTLFTGCTLTPLVAKGTKNGKITILEQRSLYFADRKGIPFEGVSDLTYNKKYNRLYMIGDRGYLYSFYAKFSDKIERLRYLDAFHIKTPSNRTIHPDIEGLTHNQKGELIASFEREPRVKEITYRGRLKKSYKIPKKLQNRRVYKSRNKMFEAVAYHNRYGILIASEYPINRKKNIYQTIYSLNGMEWHFRAEKHKNSAITAIEIMDNNTILVLERAYSGLSNPFYTTLKRVYLNRCNRKRECKSEVLATFSSSKGWGYNNFEGLAKVSYNRYVMVSDNNGHSFLPTVLTYFKVN